MNGGILIPKLGKTESEVTKQMLYYEQVVPVSAQRHQDWALEPRADFEFAGHSNSVPLVTVEFPAAAAEYSIVFAGSQGAASPAVIRITGVGSHYLLI